MARYPTLTVAVIKTLISNGLSGRHPLLLADKKTKHTQKLDYRTLLYRSPVSPGGFQKVAERYFSSPERCAAWPTSFSSFRLSVLFTRLWGAGRDLRTFSLVSDAVKRHDTNGFL